MDHPIGGYPGLGKRRTVTAMAALLEIALMAATVAFFALLDRYAAGCERI